MSENGVFMDIDLVRLNLNQSSMNILKVIIAIIMYGVALDLKFDDFFNMLKKPKAFITGTLGHYLLFPALAFLLILTINMKPSMALGFVMIAACPGGNISNVMTSLSKGNTALSVGISSFTTIVSMLATPFYLLFLGKYIPGADKLLTEIKLDTWEVFEGVFIILGIPLILGMSSRKLRPDLALKGHKLLGKLSFAFLILFVLGALSANFKFFLDYADKILGLVLVLNLLALSLAFITGKLTNLNRSDINALSYSMGLRNTALGLALVFQFFQGLGGMALVVAFYGLVQIGLGILMTHIWKRFQFTEVQA
jgi:BASS family bile acid:Na+ symporter